MRATGQVFVGVTEPAEILSRLGIGASPATVRRWADTDRLPSQRGPGGRILFRVEDAAAAVGLTVPELLAAGRDDEAVLQPEEVEFGGV